MGMVRYDDEYAYEHAGPLDRSERDIMTNVSKGFSFDGRQIDFSFMRGWLAQIREGMETYVHGEPADWEDMLKEEGFW